MSPLSSNAMSPMTVLNFNPDTHVGFGPNASGFYIDGLKVDNQARHAKIVDMAEYCPYYADIYCDRIHFPHETWDNPAFTISGKTTCQVTRTKNLHANMFAWNNSGSQGTPKFVIENCRFYSAVDALDLFDLSVSSGDCHVKVTGCIDGNNDPITDIYTTLTGAL